MAVGHTKFAPDGFFGLIKYRYRRSCIYTYDQLCDVIEESSEKGHNLCQRYRDKHGTECVEYRDWSNWLLSYCKKLPGMTHYHHFSLNSQKPGIVTVQETIDGLEEEFLLLKATFPYHHPTYPRLPQQIQPSGLSPERSWYLYDKIREHIPSIEDKDKTCPKPIVKKSKKENLCSR